ncbi:MAG: enoyl-CoA hydratase-related protein [Lentisphaeraceae bacterium]|nr:enoyl-CoA hydratase-related protein [Lentisphaeraceae bacterium]
MQKYETIELQIPVQGVATVILNREAVHNAMNERMIDELTDVFQHLTNGNEIRLICLKANGKNFCAGADLNWMKDVAKQEYDDCNEGSMKLYNMFKSIAKSRPPIVACVQGAVYGGGLGLLAVSDYVIASTSSKFCFSELKLGLLPATISPFVMRKIGYSAANALFLSARTFNSDYALQIGLIHHLSDNLEKTLDEVTENFLKTAPKASAVCKEMIRSMEEGISDEKHYTAGLISRARLSAEGQEGMNALFEKRSPSWTMSKNSPES